MFAGRNPLPRLSPAATSPCSTAQFSEGDYSEIAKKHGYTAGSRIPAWQSYNHPGGHRLDVHLESGTWNHYKKGGSAKLAVEGKSGKLLDKHLSDFHASQHSEIPRLGPTVSAPCSPPVQFRESPVVDSTEQFGEGDYVPAPNKHEIQEGHRVKVNYGEHKGKTGVVDHLAPSGHFAAVSRKGKHLGYYHESDLLHHKENF